MLKLPQSLVFLERRVFLRRASLVCGMASAMTTMPALATVASPRSRQLRFVHTHTGESMTACYFNGADYDASCLAKVNHLLRDFRTGEVHDIDAQLLDILYDLQVLADRDAPFEIISGYRSPTTNAMLNANSQGVARLSQHMFGKALDIRLQGFSTQRLSQHARSLKRGGVGFYRDSDFVHIDTARVRYW